MSKKEEKPIGQMALIAVKKQSTAVEVFKKPQLVQKIKKKKVILSEEKYLQVSFEID